MCWGFLTVRVINFLQAFEENSRIFSGEFSSNACRKLMTRTVKNPVHTEN